MKLSQIEAWALSVIDLVSAGERVEDSRVELKAAWLDPAKTARRLAAHANAAGGESILWIVGLDEESGVVGAGPEDLADWYSQVRSWFDGLAPAVRDIVIPTGEGQVVALLFDSSRAPFVVKNPVFGQPGGGPVALEVPWREGTQVRSAKREDLIRLLAPLETLPDVTLLDASASIEEKEPMERMYAHDQPAVVFDPHIEWWFHLSLYVTPTMDGTVVFPVHQTVLSFEGAGTGGFRESIEVSYGAPSVHTGSGFRSDSHTAATTTSEAIVTGPGRLNVRARFVETPFETRREPIRLRFRCTPAGHDRAVSFELELAPSGNEGRKKAWRLETAAG